MKKIILIFSVLVTGVESHAGAISNRALFRRCYAMITQSFPGMNHPLLQGVTAGTVNPIAACLQILDKASLGPTGTIANTSDLEARKVLYTFQSLHYGWMESRDFSSGLPELNQLATKDFYDMASPAYYYTRALFRPGMKFEDIFLTNDVYGPIKTTMDPTIGLFTNRPIADWIMKPSEFVPFGDLLGVRSIASYTINLGPRSANVLGPSIIAFKNYGGGVLGSAPYINYTLRQDSSLIRSDAAVNMPRKWSKAVFNDFLCRTLPVVRVADTAFYAMPAAQIPFRQSESCVRCHASMDQMAGTIRNLTLTTYETSYLTNPSPLTTAPFATTLSAETSWPTTADSNYYRRPPTGRFVFRTFNGTALNEPVANVLQLGERIRQLDDPYVCAAKRYYEYFMGVDIPMRDFGDPDPSVGYQLSSSEQKHWNKIVQLGQGLKTSQSTRQLIENILNLPGFKETDFDPNGDFL